MSDDPSRRWESSDCEQTNVVQPSEVLEVVTHVTLEAELLRG
jgi:hypothetical protein